MITGQYKWLYVMYKCLYIEQVVKSLILIEIHLAIEGSTKTISNFDQRVFYVV